MTKTPFYKYSGNGNDFIIVDERHFNWSEERIKQLCDRHFGIGADGVVVVGNTQGFDATMRIFNADGREAEMCGNGLRCLVHYLYDFVEKKGAYHIKTMKTSFHVEQKNEKFFIEMGVADDVGKYDLSVLKDQFSQVFFIDTGVPHLCFLVDDSKKIDIKAIAPHYRFHSIFPNGTNVNFIHVLDQENQKAYVRTFERGVEDETLSCGTGVTACAHTLRHFLGWKGKIHIENRGGEHLVEISDKVKFSGTELFLFKGEV